MKMTAVVERWSSAIKGLLAFAAVSGLGGLAIFTYQIHWVAGGLASVALTGGSDRTVSMVGDHMDAASELWPLILLGAACLGLAVWIMDSVAQRLGPPYSD